MEIDPSAKEVADTGLRHAEFLGCLSLLKATGGDELLNLDHEIRSDQEMLGLFAAEAEVAEHITGRGRHLELHGSPNLLSGPVRRNVISA